MAVGDKKFLGFEDFRKCLDFLGVGDGPQLVFDAGGFAGVGDGLFFRPLPGSPEPSVFGSKKKPKIGLVFVFRVSSIFNRSALGLGRVRSWAWTWPFPGSSRPKAQKKPGRR